jgi:phosphoribosylglycinamide formyltransferase-1
MADTLASARARLVVLAGFDHILAPIFFVKLAGVPVINIHPALLPFFGGKGMHGDKVHAAVLKARAKESGVTVHRVHPDTVDLGEVIVQRRVPVHEGDDVPTLSARVLAVEHEAIVEAVRRFLPAQATVMP